MASPPMEERRMRIEVMWKVGGGDEEGATVPRRLRSSLAARSLRPPLAGGGSCFLR